MKKPDNVIEIFLQPGDYYFGDRDTRIRTILGSCVSIAMWHPSLLIGGMCHYMLPTRNRGISESLDGRYADEAMAMFLRDITAAGTRPSEYRVKMFGGGNMFFEEHDKNCPNWPCANPSEHTCHNISCRNEQTALALAKLYDFKVQASHLGGKGHRQVIFDIWTGHVWVKHCPIVRPVNLTERL